jgi:hypothetical protein
MANEEHLKILKQGVEAWNRWRKGHPRVRPKLGEANFFEENLSGADLRGADLSQATLIWANLSNTNLTRADLTLADLAEANLSQANLCDAYLLGARLWGANLCSADLSGAELSQVNLTAATLDGADFTLAMAGFTTFGDNDLSRVRGLESVLHRSPSTVGIDTVYKSKGNIPEAFLRGAGVPEDFITYMKPLVGKPIEFYSCFISHSSKDDDFARLLHGDLQQKHIRVWFAPEDLKIGDKFRMRIDESIRIYDKVIVILSTNSVESLWVEEEVEVALEKERKENKLVLFPIRLDDAVMGAQQAWAASLRRTRHIGDFRTWKNHDAYKQAFDRLLRDLKAGKTVASE